MFFRPRVFFEENIEGFDGSKGGLFYFQGPFHDTDWLKFKHGLVITSVGLCNVFVNVISHPCLSLYAGLAKSIGDPGCNVYNKHIYGVVLDCGNAPELSQPCTKPSIFIALI